MSTTVTLTLADLHLRNIAPTPHEAVAVVLSLMDHTPTGAVNHDTSRFELPSTATIHLAADGSVSTENPADHLAPADLATLLQQILVETPGVPPGLMYSIARALRMVEAPPFESTDAFLRTLARFERGDRADVVRQLVARFDAAPGPEPRRGGTRLDRRRTPVLVNNLRKELRAVDRRKYEESVAETREVAALSPVTGPPTRVVRIAIAVSFAAALACLSAADSVLAPSVASVATVVAPPVLPIAAVASPVAAAIPVAEAAPAKENGRPPSPTRASAANASPRHASAPARITPKKESRLHVVFRLGWTRHLITIHRDDES